MAARLPEADSWLGLQPPAHQHSLDCAWEYLCSSAGRNGAAFAGATVDFRAATFTGATADFSTSARRSNAGPSPAERAARAGRAEAAFGLVQLTRVDNC
jgi:hypothetical protein